jgi:type II secretory pathway component PulF
MNNLKEKIKASGKKLITYLNKPRLSQKNQALFAKRLSILLKSGIPLLESLDLMKNQISSSEKIIVESIIQDISNGKTLSHSMKKQSRIFDDLTINLVKVGEITGNLEDNLQHLSNEIEKNINLKMKIIGALLYPSVVMLGAIGMTGFLTLYLFPKLTPVLKNLHVKLPLSTKILVFLSETLTKYWPMLIFILFFSLILILSLRKKPKVRLYAEISILKVPVIGSLIQNYYLSNICRTLGVLLKENCN